MYHTNTNIHYTVHYKMLNNVNCAIQYNTYLYKTQYSKLDRYAGVKCGCIVIVYIKYFWDSCHRISVNVIFSSLCHFEKEKVHDFEILNV